MTGFTTLPLLHGDDDKVTSVTLSPVSSTPSAADVTAEDVFEGPEKKLEVFFHVPDAAGFRRFDAEAWSAVLAPAACSILHRESNDHFDAYLLSESSLFVYPHKLVLKTCGTTTLLLVMPEVLALAAKLGASLSHVHYSHLRYKYPQLQLYPHSSFAEEEACLRSMLCAAVAGEAREGGGKGGEAAAEQPAVAARVLGPEGGGDSCWYAMCADVRPTPPPATPLQPQPAAVRASDCAVLEVAMEGLSPSVCALFFGSSAVHNGATGKALATSMSAASGIRALVASATLDDWAFEPCGYSMNALHGEHYYTVHITPEPQCSYASFETTDPAFLTPAKLAEVLAVFQPATFTLTLTTRGDGAATDDAAAADTAATTTAETLATSSDGFVLCGSLAEQLAASNDGYSCASNESTRLTAAVAVTCATFVTCADAAASPAASAASSSSEERRAASSASSSSGDSESTAPLLDEGSLSEGEVRLGVDGAEEAAVQPAPTKKAKTAP